MHMANIPEHLFFYRRWENQLSTSQLDRQTLSAQAIQRDLLRTTLGMTLTDEESRIYTQMNLRVGTLRRDELTTYRGLLKTTLPRELRTPGPTIRNCCANGWFTVTSSPANVSIPRGP